MGKKTFKVVRISEETTNGNNIITLKSTEEKDTPFGTKVINQTLCTTVKAGTAKVSVDDELELDSKDYTIERRDWQDDEGKDTYTNWVVWNA